MLENTHNFCDQTPTETVCNVIKYQKNTKFVTFIFENCRWFLSPEIEMIKDISVMLVYMTNENNKGEFIIDDRGLVPKRNGLSKPNFLQ